MLAVKALIRLLVLAGILFATVPAFAQDSCPDVPWLIRYGQHMNKQRDKLEEELVKAMVEIERLTAKLPKDAPKTDPQPKDK